MENSINDKRVGFWIRLLATWVDFVIIYFTLKLLFYGLLFSGLYIYFPFNFSFFVVGIVYSVLFISFKGQTIGKYLMGIKVYNKDGSNLSIIKSILRETVFKFISALGLLFGFFWIGFTRKKRGWHDYLGQSKVIPAENKPRFSLYLKLIALASFVILSSIYVWNFARIIIDAKKIELSPESVQLPFMKRDTSTLMDVSALRDSVFVDWLDKNSETPEDYAIHIAAAHQLTVFGEMHENKDYLLFFNKIIDALYFKSGVRVVAMEVLPATMNKKLEKLVNGKNYDTLLAMEIARSNNWKAWGMKEYWDVMKTVWRLNQSLPVDAEKMRLIGLDEDFTMPNYSLLDFSEDSKGKTPFWEKFRIFSLIEDFPVMAYRDEIMARNVEKEIIDKNQKGVVLIGFAHSYMNYANPVVKDNKVIAVKPRFGVLLHQKYRDKIFQIELFQHIDDNTNKTAGNGSMDNFMDTIMKKRNNEPSGFTITSSPFENIRDHFSSYFSKVPSTCYGDIAQGLIFLTPLSECKKCSWQPGYISDEMFMKYKPMYELLTKQKFKNADEVNKLFNKLYSN